jgi:cystathionine beta-lyase/cystathionine gamma-synthase
MASEEKEELGINAYSLRLSLGLDEAEDIIEDLR